MSELPLPKTIASRTVAGWRGRLAGTALWKGLKDVWWRLRGASIRNPEPGPVGSMVFVCLGNICRSPFAALAAERELRARGRTDITVTSAGIRARSDGLPPADARAAAAGRGLSLDGHRTQLLSADVVSISDLIVVMEASQWWALRAAYPDAADRIVLLPLLGAEPAGGYERFNIADPFGRSSEAFDSCYRRIDALVAALCCEITAAPTRPPVK